MSDERLKAIWAATDELCIKAMTGKDNSSIKTKHRDFTTACRQNYLRDIDDSDASENESEPVRIHKSECDSKKTDGEIRYERLGSFEAVPEEFRPTKSKASLMQIGSKLKNENDSRIKDPLNTSHMPLNVTSKLQDLEENRRWNTKEVLNSEKSGKPNSSTYVATENQWLFPAKKIFTYPYPEDNKTFIHTPPEGNNTPWESNQEMLSREVSFQDSGLRCPLGTSLCKKFAEMNLGEDGNLHLSQENKRRNLLKKKCFPNNSPSLWKFEDNSKCNLTEEEQRIWTRRDDLEDSKTTENRDISHFFRTSGGTARERDLCSSKETIRYSGAENNFNRYASRNNRTLVENQQLKSTDSIEFSNSLKEYIAICSKNTSNNAMRAYKNMNAQSWRSDMKHAENMEVINRKVTYSHSFRNGIDVNKCTRLLRESERSQINKKNKRAKYVPPLVRHEIKVIHVNQSSYRNNERFVHNEETAKKVQIRNNGNSFVESDSDSSCEDYYKFKNIIKKDISWSVINSESEANNELRWHRIGTTEKLTGTERILQRDSKNAYDFKEDKLSGMSSSESSDDQNLHLHEKPNFETSLKNQQAEDWLEKSPCPLKESLQSADLNNLNEGVDETKAVLIQYGREISDLLLGSERTLDMFLSFYRKWIEMRHKTMLLMEKIMQAVNNYSKKHSTFTNIVNITNYSSKAAAVFPDVRVSLPAKIVSFLSDIMSKILKSPSDLQDLKIDEFEINRCLQEDIDSTSIVYMYGIQCDQQFQETNKLIEEFHQSIVNGTYVSLSENMEISDFLYNISELNPKHHGFYKRLQKCYEAFRVHPTSEISRAFLGALDDWTSAVKTIGQLDWRFYTDGFDGSAVHREWEEVSQLLQNAKNVPVREIADKIQACALVLNKEQKLLERAVCKLTEPK